MRSSDFAPLPGVGAVVRGFAALATAVVTGDRTADATADGEQAAERAAAEADAAGEAERRHAFESGFAEGRASREGEIASILAAVRDTLEQVARFRGDLRHRYERELLEVALGVARKVVRQEMTEHPEHWLEMIRAAIAHAVDREQVIVRVPPALGTFLREADPPLRTMVADVRVLEIVDDPGLPEGACVLETRFGDVDAGLDTQLDACERALIGSAG